VKYIVIAALSMTLLFCASPGHTAQKKIRTQSDLINYLTFTRGFSVQTVMRMVPDMEDGKLKTFLERLDPEKEGITNTSEFIEYLKKEGPGDDDTQPMGAPGNTKTEQPVPEMKAEPVKVIPKELLPGPEESKKSSKETQQRHAAGESIPGARVIFSFEKDLETWYVPDWAYEKDDHVQKEIHVSDKVASDGKNSLEITTDFPGGKWAGAVIEVMRYFDWSAYSALSCDIYIPPEAPKGLKARIILTVGESWKWVEMARAVNLIPGEWTTVRADLMPGSIDWRRVKVDDGFRADVRKVDIRVVSNGKPAYSGPIFIDNIALSKK